MNPFAEGYTEALRQSLPPEHRAAPLADETLAAILRDCEAYDFRPGDEAPLTPQERGAEFWQQRQHNVMRAFPPLTPYLGDDGRVYLREVGQ